MLVGLVSDIHGNKPALDAVLDDMPAVDALACAGDVVGYNPWPGACVDAMRERDAVSIRGNHDRAVVTETGFSFNSMAGAGVEHARDRLTDRQFAWLDALPTERTAFGGRVKLVHGHPDDPDRYTYPGLFSERLLGDEDVLVMGHTHVQHHERYDAGVVVNPGSVGQPRDGDPDAAYALLDTETLEVEERRVAYDVERVVARVREEGLPDEIGTRLRKGR
ncbi:metallophosphoesterase family protein [Halosegnis marinus]|uniref:Phosphoesterase n=1 Tax=Halosegnis marinus TaxID=3034023 RepID=A0ABD5ZNJ3_9EURY|nr:metallophosphoesterase family protein [Halosegnis sp. DT85]